MATKIWDAAAATPTGTHRIPADTSAAGGPTRYTVQQLADLKTSVGITANALGNITGATSISLASGGIVTATVTGNTAFTFDDPPVGATEWTLVLTNGGAFTITWPATTWAGATAPTLTASGVDVIRFTSPNGGTTWYGWHEVDAPAVTPGGSGSELQYRIDASTFGGMAGVSWDNTNRAETRTGATVTTSNPVQSFTQTWNAGAVTFTGWKINVTDTASASASLIADLQVGGSTKFAVGKTGVTQAFRYTNLTGASSGGLDFLSGYTRLLSYSASVCFACIDGGAGLFASGIAAWGANYFTPDVYVYRDAANTLNMRNGTSAQTLRVSGTHTDASNYVRASLASTSTAVTLSAETAGTGADNVPVVISPAGTSQVEIGNGVQFTEMTAPAAPAANKVILFAQDNGAGKTQLMALFASGAAQQVAIEP